MWDSAEVWNYWVECRKPSGEWGRGHVVKRTTVGSRLEIGLYRISSEMQDGACHCKSRCVRWNVGSRRGHWDLGMSLNSPLSEVVLKWDYIA